MNHVITFCCILLTIIPFSLIAQSEDSIIVIRYSTNSKSEYLELTNPIDSCHYYENFIDLCDDFSEHYAFWNAIYLDNNITISKNDKLLIWEYCSHTLIQNLPYNFEDICIKNSADSGSITISYADKEVKIKENTIFKDSIISYCHSNNNTLKQTQYLQIENLGNIAKSKIYTNENKHMIIKNLDIPYNYQTSASLPQFPGGTDSLYSFLRKYIAIDTLTSYHIEGTAYVELIVSELGQISNVKIIRGINNELDTLIYQTFHKMPLWFPALIDNKATTVKMILPIKITTQ